MNFLSHLVKVFPSLKTRPLHLTGESYAGTYIVRLISVTPKPAMFMLTGYAQPYITKTYFGMTDPPVNLSRIAIGDGAIGSFVEFEIMPTVRLLLSSEINNS